MIFVRHLMRTSRVGIETAMYLSSNELLEAVRNQKAMGPECSHVASGNEIGKQGRAIAGDGKDGVLAVIGTGLEAWGHLKSTNTAKPESLIQDFEARKRMLDSWRFFKASH